jgi:hypothetical protein
MVGQVQPEELPKYRETIPFSTFFKLWYAVQKGIPQESRGEVLTKIAKSIADDFNPEGITTIDEFLEAARHFLVDEWAITEEANLEALTDDNGKVVAIANHMSSCKFCAANTYYKLVDEGAPSCMMPQVMMGILGKVKNTFHFRNLAFETVNKAGVGDCTQTWKVA